MARKWQNNRNDMGSTLAACIVIVLGSVFCLLLIFAGGNRGETPWMIGAVCAVASLFLGFLIFLRWGNKPTWSLGFWHTLFRNPPDDGLASQYNPRKVVDNSSQGPMGGNRPITAAEAHEIQSTSASAWVPTRDRRYTDDDDD
jgi:hypothetical protein